MEEMGIPSYFSYIIKNYSNIIRNLLFLKSNGIEIHYLFMDCNSIIYDAFRAIENSNSMNVYQLEELIIENVISKMNEYFDIIRPSKFAMIAFDGVAPLAKMDQQRSRRYKNAPNHASTEGWSTANITPGTAFMKKISRRLNSYYEGHKKSFDVIVTTSEECGEGEHKLFQKIRNHSILPNENAVVYGLDSDLIMLSIFHCSLFKNFYIFREASEFIKSSISLPNDEKQPNYYLMDIKTLSNSILSEMQCGISDANRIYDYVFLCFFLGNDFLPHFPSLNIRTHGITVLLDIYRLYIGNYPDRFLTSSRLNGKSQLNIQWKWVKLFVKELAKREHEYIIQEYNLRSKWDRRTWPIGTDEDKNFAIQSVPVIYRPEEQYICPSEQGWEMRYYKCLFHNNPNPKSISINYLEGLEWVFKYYTIECPHWRWKYNYNYPPLLKDLHNCVPSQEYSFISADLNHNKPFKPNVQLAYVLPVSSHYLLDHKTRDVLHKKYTDLYPTTYKYKWAFCRYLWEAHAELPDISMETIRQWEKKLLYTDEHLKWDKSP